MRKNHTNYLIQESENFLYKITHNHAKSGLVAFLFHMIVCGYALLYILIGEIDWLFYISASIWISIFIMHFYFSGCPITRLERHLWKDEKWWGPWMLGFSWLELVGVEITGNLSKNIFVCWGILVAAFIFFKMLYKL